MRLDTHINNNVYRWQKKTMTKQDGEVENEDYTLWVKISSPFVLVDFATSKKRREYLGGMVQLSYVCSPRSFAYVKFQIPP